MTELSRCHPSPSSPPMGTGLHRRAWRAHMGWPLASWQSAESKGMWVESYCCCRAFNRADGGLPHVPSFTSGWRHMAKKKKKNKEGILTTKLSYKFRGTITLFTWFFNSSSSNSKPRQRPGHKVKNAGSLCHQQPRTPRKDSWHEQERKLLPCLKS